MDLIVHMTTQQADFIKNKVLTVFRKKTGFSVKLINIPDLDEMVPACKRYNESAGLIMLPIGPAWECVRQDQCRPLELIVRDRQMKEFRENYILTEFGRMHNRQYFLPRKYETRIMAYRKSKVKDAVERFDSMKVMIDSTMKKINGFGLPEDYKLENDPSQWDFFDIFVVGKIWGVVPYTVIKQTGDSAKKEQKEDVIKPRVAHRGKHYSGTSLRLIDRAFQCGADISSMLRMKGGAVVDAFYWEAIYAWAGIYNPDMITDEWEGSDIWDGFSTGEVFLSFMTQLDCFELHSRQFSDVGYAVMPAGCSADVNRRDGPVRKGSRKVTTGGWWWAIPRGYRWPEAAVTLFGYITSSEFHLKECLDFGMIPVRQDVLKSEELFKGWKGNIFRESYKQVQLNGDNFIVKNPAFNEISELYLDAWIEIVSEKKWSSEKEGPPQRVHIKRILERFSSKAGRALD